jgi:hypothetical protein
MRSAPLERELLVERSPVRDPGQRVGRGLRGRPAKIGEHPHDRAGQHERHEDEERERADRGVADSPAVWSDAGADGLLRPKREEAHSSGIRHPSRQRPVRLVDESDCPAFVDKLVPAADQDASAGDRQAVAAGVGGVPSEPRGQLPVERNRGEELPDAPPVEGQGHRLPDRGRRHAAGNHAAVKAERDPGFPGREASHRCPIPGEERPLHRR